MRDRQARAFRALEEAIRKQGPEPVRAQAVQLVRELTNEVRSSPRFGQGLAELTVLELDAKINTWATSVWSNKPETMPEIVKEIDRQFCEGDLAAEEYVLFGKLGLKVPELLSVRALDCVFGRRNQEDIVTWTLLDAWRFSGQPKTEAITAIEAAASDPRTKLRFMSPDEELALRMPAAR